MTDTYAVAFGAATDLVAALGLSTNDGDAYILEVPQGNPAVRLFEGGASAPTDLSYFHTIQPGRALGIRARPGDPIWVWTTAGSGTRLVVSEV